MEFFRCCKMCVPPKRYSGCHEGCPDYIDAKKAYNAYQDSVKKADKARRDTDSILHSKRHQRR